MLARYRSGFLSVRVVRTGLIQEISWRFFLRIDTLSVVFLESSRSGLHVCIRIGLHVFLRSIFQAWYG